MSSAKFLRARMNDKKYFWLLCSLLAVVTIGVFGPVVHHDFICFDDPDYVTQNPIVQSGLTWDGIVWAFKSKVAANWHPLTWISHMIDCEIYGKNPAGHHLTNLLFHIANTLLLFSILTAATGAMWRGAMVAALFALHPLHVESVAWVSERKDVLSTLFWLLTMWAYTHWMKQKTSRAEQATLDGRNVVARFFSTARNTYFLALLFFALGLMSKPMLVVLPFALLLWDFWPLKRIFISEFKWKIFLKLCIEKIPFFVLSAASSWITFVAQKEGGSVWSLASVSFYDRVANALVSYVKYVGLTFFPTGLAILYPFHKWPLSAAIAATAILICISLFVVRQASARTYIVVGWFWFLGTLVPVIGFVQVGWQSMADRYTYVPSIGLFIALVWGASDFLSRRPKPIRIALVSIVLVSCAILTSRQLGYWQNSVTLFERTIAVTDGNFIAQNDLGYALSATGQTKKALPHFAEALRLYPKYAEAHNNLAMALVESGKAEEALPHFREAIALKPGYAEAYYNLAQLLQKQGKTAEAMANYEQAARLKPDFGAAHLALAIQFAAEGKLNDAISHYRAALSTYPNDAKAHYNLANALLKTGQIEEAVRHYKAALAVNPADAQCHNNLASALQQLGKMQEAAEHFREAIRLDPKNPDAHFNLALLLMRQGNNSEAIAQLDEVIRLQPQNAQAHYQIGDLLAGQKQIEAAIAHFQTAVRLKPDWPVALNFLARILATSSDSKLRNGEEAVKLAEQACKLTGFGNLAYLDTLGAALAEKGDFAGAIRAAQQAKKLALKANQNEAVEQIELHIQRYQKDEPWRESTF
jgi:tetratricopeptide (TPR) repeat protein